MAEPMMIPTMIEVESSSDKARRGSWWASSALGSLAGIPQV